MNKKQHSDPFTSSEKTDKNYTVGYALECARRLVGGRQVCTNAISHFSLSDRITLQQVNELRDQMVDDTNFYGN